MGPPAPGRSSASLLGQIAIERRLRDPQRPADVLDRVRRVAMEHGGVPLLLVVELAGAAAPPPAAPRRGAATEGPVAGRDPGVADPHRTGSPAVPRSPPGPVSQIPSVRASRETLKSRRLRETRIGLPGRLAHRRPAGLI